MIRTPSLSKHGRSKSGAFGSRKGGSASDSSAGLDRVLLGLRAAWCLIVLYGEVWKFTGAASSCSWPSDFRYELTRSGAKPFKLLLVADPQILDLRSYPGRNVILKYLGIWITDNYARKSWRTVLKRHRPDAVFFLGDLLDSGVEVTDRDEHSHYVHRFQNIFKPIPHALPMHYIPGNHDLGLHLSPGGSAYARERFTETFGPLNGEMTLGNHTIVWLDTPGLLEERTIAADSFGTAAFQPAAGGVADFLQAFKSNTKTLPRILFSHIPLYRSEGMPCGPLRESRNNLHQGRGKNYQNEVDEVASRYMLDAVEPAAVFSGDDHDYCDVVHHTAQASFHEVTCKSFSMAMGMSRPGYQLVSLLNPQTQAVDSAAATQVNRLCLLPDQISIYTHLYVPCIFLTLAFLFLPRIYRSLQSRKGTLARANGLPMHSQSLSRSILGRNKVKPADEDDNDVSNMASDDENDLNNSFVSGYPMTPAHANYAYHSPTDDEYVSIATPFEVVPRQGKSRVRRVSRVWLWDQKPEEDYLKAFKRLGPIYRLAIRPSERSLRRVFHKLYGRRLQFLASKINSGNALGETIRDFFQIAWVALLLYGLVWLWYTW